MKKLKKILYTSLITAIFVTIFSGCSGEENGGNQQIVRIGHVQASDHPTNIGLVEFEKFIEERLGDKYDVEVYPSELLGSQVDMVQLTQTGAIDFCVASNAILETFSKNYEIFNLPYLFASPEVYHEVMNDTNITDQLFKSTEKAGFEAVTWLDAGTRNFYTVKTPINSPNDLKGLKIRVQQSPSNVEMMRLLGGSATPMGFGEVYTSLQSNIIDGAENNELALTSNGHGDVCKFYSYDMHQMVPDILIGNYKFLSEMSNEEREIFEEGFKLINSVANSEWTKAVEASKEKAEKEQGVTFIYPDQQPFVEACKPLHQTVLNQNPNIKPIYDAVQVYNTKYENAK